MLRVGVSLAFFVAIAAAAGMNLRPLPHKLPLAGLFADVNDQPWLLPDEELESRLARAAEWSRTSPPPDTSPQQAVPCYACERTVATSFDTSCEDWCTAEWSWAWGWACSSLCRDVAAHAGDCIAAGYCEDRVYDTSYRPVVLMHGFGGNSEHMEPLKAALEDQYPGIYVRNIELGNGREYSILHAMWTQIEAYAKQIQDDPHLAAGFDAASHSQGTLITRGYLQAINSPPVRVFVSYTGPQAGVFGLPHLPDYEWVAEILSKEAYRDAIQHYIGASNYWRDPFHLDQYLAKARLLPYLDNTIEHDRSELFKKNFLSLDHFAEVMSTVDTTVIPFVSEWNGVFVTGSDKETEPVEKRAIWTQDLFGLRTLSERGAVSRSTCKCTHKTAARPNKCPEAWSSTYKLLGNKVDGAAALMHQERIAEAGHALFADAADPTRPLDHLPVHDVNRRIAEFATAARAAPSAQTPQQAVPCYACERTVATSYDTSCEDWCTAEWSWAWGWACSSLCRDVAAHAGDCIAAGYCEDRVYDTSYRPVVLMHGLGGCQEQLEEQKAAIEKAHPGIYVRNVEIGNGRLSSIWTPMWTQTATFAKILADDPRLAGGVDVVGHSQGTMIARGYIERYNAPAVHVAVFLTGPQNGVFGVPGYDWIPAWLDHYLSEAAYWSEAQAHIAPAGYWHDASSDEALDEYRNGCLFLPIINNDHHTDKTFAPHFASLEQLVLVDSSEDVIVIPARSADFDYYATGTQDVQPVQERPEYLDDWFGLAELDKRGGIVRVTIACDHRVVPKPSRCPDGWSKATAPFIGNKVDTF